MKYRVVAPLIMLRGRCAAPEQCDRKYESSQMARLKHNPES